MQRVNIEATPKAYSSLSRGTLWALGVWRWALGAGRWALGAGLALALGMGMGWDGMGWDGMGWDEMGWDGMGDGDAGHDEWSVLPCVCDCRAAGLTRRCYSCSPVTTDQRVSS